MRKGNFILFLLVFATGILVIQGKAVSQTSIVNYHNYQAKASITTMTNGTIICGGLVCIDGSKGCKVQIQTTFDNRWILTTRECYDKNGKVILNDVNTEVNQYPNTSFKITSVSMKIKKKHNILNRS
uniref:Secreted protein n=1 Tax=Xenopsylla cheopis TaxID=163159 RepID=A0A6M2DUK7_XENCH